MEIAETELVEPFSALLQKVNRASERVCQPEIAILGDVEKNHPAKHPAS
jgi:hypothetical protein